MFLKCVKYGILFRMRQNLLIKSICAVFCILLFFSCSNSQSLEAANLTEETLKNAAAQKDSELLWTRELESVRLTRDYSKNVAAAKNFKLSPGAISVANTNADSVYPCLPDFGSLDNSSLSTELTAFLESFCNEIALWNLNAVKMEQDSEFSLVLFKYDVEENWLSVYGRPFPVAKPAVAENSSEVPDGGSASEEKKRLFSDWLYGMPFFDGDSVLVPVRFTSSFGTLDVSVYVCTGSAFAVRQIEIQKMQ